MLVVYRFMHRLRTLNKAPRVVILAETTMSRLNSCNARQHNQRCEVCTVCACDRYLKEEEQCNEVRVSRALNK